MKKAKSKFRRAAELTALKKVRNEEIDLTDIPEVLDWDDAVRGKFFRPIKQAVSLRMDADVLAWFKARGDKYQTRINQILREYMVQHRRTGR